MLSLRTCRTGRLVRLSLLLLLVDLVALARPVALWLLADQYLLVGLLRPVDLVGLSNPAGQYHLAVLEGRLLLEVL